MNKPKTIYCSICRQWMERPSKDGKSVQVRTHCHTYEAVLEAERKRAERKKR